MAKIRFIFILLVLSSGLAACASFNSFEYSTGCIPHFPDRDGWYGGDGAYSIPLDNQRTLWLFGDTFVSEEVGRKDRIGMDVVMGNTVGISTCTAHHDFSIQYFLKKKNSKFVSFFGENEWLWPQDPFIANRVLYIPLLVIQIRPDATAPFNFRIAGYKIARVKDFSNDDPRKWPVDYLDWTPALPGNIEALSATSIVDGDYVYFVSLYRKAGTSGRIDGNILVRIPLNRLENPAGALEYLNRNGSWGKELLSEEIKIIFSAAVSELSVRYHAQQRKWLAVYLSPADKGRKLLVQTSKHLEGPWSAPLPLIESIAELEPASPYYDRDTFCYAGKEHIQYARDKNLILTYVCNSMDQPDQTPGFLRKNLFLYRPVVKSVTCPPNICH